MEVKLDSLIPYETIKSDSDVVFDIVEKNGKVVLLKDNHPAYIITKYDVTRDMIEQSANVESLRYTLQDAMKIVLSEALDKTMHAAALADEIFKRGLYRQRNGGKAQYNQIRARCGHYPEMFKALPGNYIRLKEDIN